MDIKASKTVFLASFAALLGALSMGLSLGYSSPALAKMKADNCPQYNCAHHSGPNSTVLDTNPGNAEWQESMIGSSLAVGALFGGLIGEPSNRLFGRRMSLIICGIPFALGWLIIALSTKLQSEDRTSAVGFVITGRVLTGLMCGLASQTAPTYVVEIAPPSIRGALGTCFQVMVTIGILLVPLFSLALSWQTNAFVCSLFAIAMSVMMYFVPETPQWLLTKNRNAEAEASLRSLRASPIADELNAMTQTVNATQQSRNESFAKTIKERSFYVPLGLALGLMFFQQFSAINAIIFYQESIFSKAAPSFSPIVATIIVNTSQVLATVASSLLVDKVGRRVLLLASGAGHAVSLFVFGLYMMAGDETKASISWLALASIIGFIISFSIGYGPIPWMMIPELTSNSVRSTIASMSTAFNWICAFIVTASINVMKREFGDTATFWTFSFICVVSCAFVMFSLPETKGKSEAQIQNELLGTRDTFNTSSPAGASPMTQRNQTSQINDRPV